VPRSGVSIDFVFGQQSIARNLVGDPRARQWCDSRRDLAETLAQQILSRSLPFRARTFKDAPPFRQYWIHQTSPRRPLLLMTRSTTCGAASPSYRSARREGLTIHGELLKLGIDIGQSRVTKYI